MQQSRQSGEKPNGKSKRVSLSKRRPEIEQWVAEGRSDEWIADALGTSRQSVQSFRSRNRIMRQDIRHSRASESGEEHSDSADRRANDQTASVFEGVLDQGEEGYGLWLDPAVADDPTFRESFAGVADIRVLIQHGRIVLEPASEPGDSQESASVEPADNSTPGDGDGQRTGMVSAAGTEPDHSNSASAAGGEPGRVKFFDDNRGYGFVIRPDGGEIFFHRSEIENAQSLEAGEYVVYEPGTSQRGPAAKRVRTVG